MNWIKKLLPKFESQMNEGTLEDVMIALADPTIRKYWIKSMEEKVCAINSELDGLLTKGYVDRTRIWETIAIERRTLLRCLSMILDARDMLESERVEQDRQNRAFELHRGAAASLNLDQRS